MNYLLLPTDPRAVSVALKFFTNVKISFKIVKKKPHIYTCLGLSAKVNGIKAFIQVAYVEELNNYIC